MPLTGTQLDNFQPPTLTVFSQTPHPSPKFFLHVWDSHGQPYQGELSLPSLQGR